MSQINLSYHRRHFNINGKVYTGINVPLTLDLPMIKGNQIEKLRYLFKNEKNVKQKRRYDSVFLCMEGYTEKETSEILYISLRTVNANVSLCKLDSTIGMPYGKETVWRDI